MNSLASKPNVVKSTKPVRVVKLYPELAIAAMKRERDIEFALWVELKSLDRPGTGFIKVEDVLPVLVPTEPTKLSPEYYTRRTFYRILRLGDGFFWVLIHPDDAHPYTTIHLRSNRRMAKILGCYHLSNPRAVNAADFIDRQKRRAWLYSSQFRCVTDNQVRNPVSREALETATGVNRRSQARYDRAVKNHRVANFGVFQDNKGNITPQMVERKGKDKIYHCIRRLPNTYANQGELQGPGMTKRINRELKGSGCSSQGDDHKKPDITRVFFNSARALVKCPKRGGESFLLGRYCQRLINGRVEWIVVPAPSFS